MALFILLLLVISSRAYPYYVKATRESDVPLLSHVDKTSSFLHTFNPTWVEPSAGTKGKSGLLIRVQNCPVDVGGKCVHCSGKGEAASALAFSEMRPDGSFTPINKSHLVFGPSDASDSHGTEDPRLTYNEKEGLYYMFYTAYNSTHARLHLATTTDPTSPNSWKRHGPVFPSINAWTKSAALLIRPEPPHYLLWGDTDIKIAISSTLTKWRDPGKSLIRVRSDAFDSKLVESGPPPFLLSTGDYVFFYNSATHEGSVYNPAWLILDGNDPSKVKQRADIPMLSPELPWELGVAPYTCNVKDVIFLEAAYRLGPDSFRVFYGGADVAIGSAIVTVTTPSKDPQGARKGFCSPLSIKCLALPVAILALLILVAILLRWRKKQINKRSE